MPGPIPTRYYQLFPDKPNGTKFFRVASGGVFHLWDPNTREWVHVTSQPAREWFSRAIENGDADLTTAEAVH
jgi:hypothetical protein